MTKTVAIDTNLLVLLIVGAADRRFITRHKNLYPVYDERHFDLLLRIINSASEVLCTPHVLAETSNLIRQTSEPMRSRIMMAFGVFLRRVREVHVEGERAARADVFIRLGLTDAALVSLDPREITVLTVDHDLHIAASHAGFDVLNLTPLFHDL